MINEHVPITSIAGRLDGPYYSEWAGYCGSCGLSSSTQFDCGRCCGPLISDNRESILWWCQNTDDSTLYYCTYCNLSICMTMTLN